VARDAVEWLAPDKPDRMHAMGFSPQGRKILYRNTKPHQTMLFSATLDGAIARLVSRYLRDPVAHEVAVSTPSLASTTSPLVPTSMSR